MGIPILLSLSHEILTDILVAYPYGRPYKYPYGHPYKHLEIRSAFLLARGDPCSCFVRLRSLICIVFSRGIKAGDRHTPCHTLPR